MLVCVEMIVEPRIVNIVAALRWFPVVSVIWIEGAIYEVLHIDHDQFFGRTFSINLTNLIDILRIVRCIKARKKLKMSPQMGQLLWRSTIFARLSPTYVWNVLSKF